MGLSAQLVDAPQAQAANGTIQSMSMVVISDGMIDPVTDMALNYPPLGPVVVDGITLDNSNTNDIVAAQDYVAYSVTVKYAATVQQGYIMGVQATLPAGVNWQAVSATASTCDQQAAVSATTITCRWTAQTETSVTFTWYAQVVSGPAYNGMTFAPKVKDYYSTYTIDGTTAPVATPTLTVAAAPATDIYPYHSSTPALANLGGQAGYQIGDTILIGSWKDDYRGIEAPSNPYSYQVKVPAGAVLMPNPVGVAAGAAPTGCADYDSSSGVTCSQPGGPGTPITVTVPVPAAGWVDQSLMTHRLAGISVYMFIPLPTATPPATDPLWGAPNAAGTYSMHYEWQVIGYDPQGLACAHSNPSTPATYDPNAVCQNNYPTSGTSPGQESGALADVHNTAPMSGTNAWYVNLTYSQYPVPSQQTNFFQQMGSSAYIWASWNSNPNYTNSQEVVPGEGFVAILAAGNDRTAASAMHNPATCMTWDSQLATLQGPAQVLGTTTMPSGIIYSYTPAVMNHTDPNLVALTDGTGGTVKQYQVEYGYDPALDGASATTLNTYSCASSPVTWSPTPVANTNVVRLTTYGVTLDPSYYVTMALPMARATTPQALAKPVCSGTVTSCPAVMFYDALTFDDSPTANHRSDYPRAALAKVHATTTSPQYAPGAAGEDTISFTVTPTIIGPVGIDSTTAKDVTLTLALDSACLDITASGTIASLEAQLAANGYPVSGTAGVAPWIEVLPGDGMAGCAVGSRNGPVIVIHLGDVTAPGSAPGALPTSITTPNTTAAQGPGGTGAVPLHYGNETYLFATPLTVPARVSLGTTNGTNVHLTTTIASPSQGELYQQSALVAPARATQPPGQPSGQPIDIRLDQVGQAVNHRMSWSTVKINTPQKFSPKKDAVTSAGVASSQTPGVVGVGETFTYNVKIVNTKLDAYGQSVMIDVLPFPGADPRVVAPKVNGLTTQRLQVVSVTADQTDGMTNTTTLTPLCTTADPATIYAMVKADVAAFSLSYADVDTWVAANGGWSTTCGPNTTAIKVVTSSELLKLTLAEAHIKVKAPCDLKPGGVIVNDFAYLAPTGGHGTLEPEQGLLPAQVVLAVNAASLSGAVYRDLNFSSTFDSRPGDMVGPDGYWPAGDKVQLLAPDPVTGVLGPVICLCDNLPFTAVIGPQGHYQFPVIPPGTYQVAVVTTAPIPVAGPVVAAGLFGGGGLRAPAAPVAPPGTVTTWNLIATDTTPDASTTTSTGAARVPVWSLDATIVNTVTVAAGTVNAVDNLLYQEPVADPMLQPDVVKATVGQAIKVPLADSTGTGNVANNDMVFWPLGSGVDAAGAPLPSVPPTGSQQILLALSTAAPNTTVFADDGAGNISYTSSPAYTAGPLTTALGGVVTLNSDGTASYKPPSPTWTGTDVFQYSWVNVYGVASTTTVTITISAAPVLPVIGGTGGAVTTSGALAAALLLFAAGGGLLLVRRRWTHSALVTVARHLA